MDIPGKRKWQRQSRGAWVGRQRCGAAAAALQTGRQRCGDAAGSIAGQPTCCRLARMGFESDSAALAASSLLSSEPSIRIFTAIWFSRQLAR
jgi:hypothetical protein